MLRLVLYDIAHPKRLLKVARACGDYGARLEYSVFGCELDDGTFGRLWRRLAGLINPEEDKIMAFSVCAACAGKVSLLGRAEMPPSAPSLFVM